MEFENVVNERRSIRRFKDIKVDKNKILHMIETAQKAPSWKNSQVTRYYAVNTPEKIAEVREFLPDFNKENTLNAGAYIISTVEHGRSGFARDGSYSSH